MNPLLVGEVFREYSKPWYGIALAYARLVWETTKIFLEQILQHLTDSEVSSAILRELIDPIMDERLDAANSKIDQTIAVYKDHPLTLNHYFQKNITAIKKARREPQIEARLRDILSSRNATIEDIPLLMSILEIEETADMNRQAAEEIFDYMNAFYKVRALSYTTTVRQMDKHVGLDCSSLERSQVDYPARQVWFKDVLT